jgi:hypothetical protein
MMRLKWKLVSVCLEIVLILTQDRCTVCAKHTIGSETVLDTPDALRGNEAQVEAPFDQFGDSDNLEAR